MDGARLAVVRHDLSPTRREESPVRVFALGIGFGTFSPPLPAGWEHVVTARAGAMLLRCADVAITVTPKVAARIPADRVYALEISSRCDLRIVMTRARLGDERRLRAFAMTPLLRECVERAVTVGYLDPANERHARIVAVMQDELATLRDAPSATTLRMPRDPMLRASVERDLEADGDPLTIAALAEAAYVSVRTFERRFVAETGLAPREWLRRARLARATIALAKGATVTEAGFASGYASTSAFVSAYRALFGITPGRVYEGRS